MEEKEIKCDEKLEDCQYCEFGDTLSKEEQKNCPHRQEKEFKSLSEWLTYIEERKASFVRDVGIKEFIKGRLFDATMLLGKFNAGNLTSIDLREHRQRIKDEAGDKLI